MAGEKNITRQEVAVVGLTSGGHFFSHYFMLALPPLFPLLKAEYGVSYAALGGLLTAAAVASGSAQYLMGILVDRIGARFVLIAGLTLLSGSIALMGLVDDFTFLFVLAALAGLGNSVFHPADYTILTAGVGHGRLGRAYAMHTFSGNIGWACAPGSMFAMASIWDWRTAVVVAGAAGLLMAALLLANQRRLVGGGRHALDPVAPAAGFLSASGLRLMMTWPILMLFCFFVMLAGIQIGIQSFTPTALNLLHDTPLASANTALTSFLITGAAGILIGGVVADRLGRLDLIAGFGFTVSALAVVAVALVPMSTAALVAVLGLAGFMIGIIAPSRDLLVRSVTPPGASGKVFGFTSSGLDVGGAVIPLAMGWLLDHALPAAVFLLAAALMLLNLIAALAATRIRPAAVAPAGGQVAVTPSPPLG